MAKKKSKDAAIFRELLASQKVVAFDHECYGCGECCSQFLPMTITEIVRLHAYAKTNGITAKYQPIACPFFDMPTRTCLVYEVRPRVCANYDCRKHAIGELMAEGDKFGNPGNYRIVDMAKEFCQKVVE